MYKKSLSIIALFFISMISPTFAQDTQSVEDVSLETRLDQLLVNINALQEKLKKQKSRRAKTTSRKLKLISKGIIRAVNSVPPSLCLDKLKIAMDDFYELTSDLGAGISCGPPILPPFLERIEKIESITTDCILPDQIGGEPFSEVYGLYTEARDVFLVDLNSSEIPDACE